MGNRLGRYYDFPPFLYALNEGGSPCFFQITLIRLILKATPQTSYSCVDVACDCTLACSTPFSRSSSPLFLPLSFGCGAKDEHQRHGKEKETTTKCSFSGDFKWFSRKCSILLVEFDTIFWKIFIKRDCRDMRRSPRNLVPCAGGSALTCGARITSAAEKCSTYTSFKSNYSEVWMCKILPHVPPLCNINKLIWRTNHSLTRDKLQIFWERSFILPIFPTWIFLHQPRGN